MQILSSEYNIAYVPIPNEVHLVLDTNLPPSQLITSALGFVFDGNRLLMPRLVNRDWDIPGGHIELGESPDETCQREIYEETRVMVDLLHHFAYQKIIIQAAKPPNYKYPYPQSYQLFFLANIKKIDPFQANEEVAERAFFTPEQAQKTKWVQQNAALYKAALKAHLHQY